MAHIVLMIWFCGYALGVFVWSLENAGWWPPEPKPARPPRVPGRFSVWWHRRGWWMMAGAFFAVYTVWAMTLPRP